MTTRTVGATLPRRKRPKTRIPIPTTITARVLKQLDQKPLEPLVSEAMLVAEAWDVPDPGFQFPSGQYWAVTRENARSWLKHQFRGMFRDPGRVGKLRSLDDDELFLLRLDLLSYEARYALFLSGEGEDPGQLDTYLQNGREHWGWL